MSAESSSVVSSKSSSNVNAHYEEIFARKRNDRRLNRKLQNRTEFSRRPTDSSIPGSPESGTENVVDQVLTSQNIPNIMDTTSNKELPS